MILNLKPAPGKMKPRRAYQGVILMRSKNLPVLRESWNRG